MIPGKPQPCVGCPSCQPQRCEVVQTDRDGRTIWLLHEQGCGCCRATICLFRDCQAHMPCKVLLLKGSRCQDGVREDVLWSFEINVLAERRLVVDLCRWMGREVS